MERYESVWEPAGKTSTKFSSLPKLASELKSGSGDNSTNYLAALQRNRQARVDGDHLRGENVWDEMICAASTLATLERNFKTRQTYLDAPQRASEVQAAAYIAQLQQLDEALDKLLSSYHSMTYDSAEKVYSSSLCVSSSRAATETIPMILALAPCLDAVVASFDKLTKATCEGVSCLSKNADLPLACLHTSESLDVTEKKVTLLEKAITSLESDVQDSCLATFDAVNAAYAASTKVFFS